MNRITTPDAAEAVEDERQDADVLSAAETSQSHPPQPERGSVEASGSAHTRRAYSADWKHFSAWCRRSGLDAMLPDPQVVGRYLTACARGEADPTSRTNSVSTIERRLSSLSWNYAQRGVPFERKDPHIATVLGGIRGQRACPPRQKEAVMRDDLLAMIETLDRGTLRGLRDRAMLLIGFAAGLRRSEIVGLDAGRGQSADGCGWIEILDKGVQVNLRDRTGWRTLDIGRGASDASCPVFALETWLSLSRISRGPLFRRVTGQGTKVGPERLNDREIARLVKRTALSAGIRGDLSTTDRVTRFSGHSLRTGLASSAEVEARSAQDGSAAD
ncbi:integrase [Rhizobium sp. SGZ-381]|uniref:integrase n=1 Tax=Rhizobium sp. SGZ-381 TaxID=3342800 RepID=UPI00366B6EC0